MCSMLATEYASPALVDAVHEQSGGNPLMLGQFLRALLDDGSLVHSLPGGWHLAPSFRPTSSLERQSTDDAEFWRRRLRALSARRSKSSPARRPWSGARSNCRCSASSLNETKQSCARP